MATKGRIVIVDNDHVSRDIYRINLEMDNYQLFFADNKKKGLKISKEIMPDLILIDLMMSEKDGFQMLEEIKKNTDLTDTPVMMLTPEKNGNAIVKSYKLGANDCLKIPFAIEEMVARANSLIQYRHTLNSLKKKLNQQNKKIELLEGELQTKTEETIKLQKQLHHAQKLESIGTLAGGIAHDFNNILYTIIGFTEISIDCVTEDKEMKRNLKQIVMAANRAKDLVSQILTYSRQCEQALSPMRMHPIIKEAMKLIRAAVPATIKIVQNIDPHCGFIIGDAIQIHQIIMNLCTNSYHAMRYNDGILEVSLSQYEIYPEEYVDIPGLKSGKYIKLTIRDTGIGMKNEVLDRIFEPYFTTKPENEGTGLGLSVVMRIIKNLGGNITVRSKFNKGTVFDMFFPRYKDESIALKSIREDFVCEVNEQ